MNIPAIGIGPLGTGEWQISPIGGLGTNAVAGLGGAGGPTSGAGTAPASGSGSFSGALSHAITSLENTQATATTAAQQLATGQLTDPTKAVTAVENASLSMDFASQIRNTLDTDATTLFQTNV